MTEAQDIGIGAMIGGLLTPWPVRWLGRKLLDPVMLEPRLQDLDTATAEQKREAAHRFLRWSSLAWGLAIFVVGVGLFLS
jgi:hypothetical protein